MIVARLDDGSKVRIFMDTLDEFAEAFESDSKSVIIDLPDGSGALLLPKAHIVVAEVVTDE